MCIGAAIAGSEIPRFTYSSAITQHAKQLEAYYKKLPAFQTVHTHERIYNLVRKSNNVNCTLNKRIIFQCPAFSNLQQTILETHSITAAEIFSCDASTECILLEGEQCVGKTQLLWELYQQRDELPALRRCQLTIMLDLKDKHAQDIRSLEDLVTYHTSHSPVQQDLIQEICDAKGKDILIIMDGFEQLPPAVTKNHDSFIVKVIEGKILPKSTKVITATPSVIRNIIIRYNLTRIQHIQLLGFHTEHIEKYTQEHLLNPHKQRVNMQSLMYLPLNASIITKFHQKCPHRLQQTLTRYYTLYCLDLIQEYLKTPHSVKTSLQYLTDLHPNIHRQFILLSKMALVEMISKDNTHQNHCTRKDFVHLGLMSSSHSHKDEGIQLQFLNHMLQTFLAAYYISQQEQSEQDQIFFNHSVNELRYVWRFVSGLCGLTPTIVEVVKASVNDLHHLPFITSLLYEQQDETTVKSVFGNEIITYSLSYPENSHDLMHRCYSLGYCIAASNCSWNLNFSSCNVKVDDLKALVNGITSLPVICGSINSLQLNGNVLSHNQILILSELPMDTVLHQLKGLNLNSCHLTQESFDFLATNIIPLTPHLQKLDIGNNNTEGHSKMSKLLSSLEDLSELQELNIEGTAFEFEDMVPLNELLSITGNTVTHLSIGGKHMALESMNLLTDTVLTQSSIENLHISDLDLTRNGDTLTLLETNTSLTRLIFFECDLDLSHLATSLCMNTILKELEIFFPLSDRESDIGSEAIVALCDMLEVNRSLNELSLYSYKPLEEKKVASLIETLTYNRTLDVLQLPHHFSKHFSTSELNVTDSRVYWKVWPCII